MSKKPLDTKNAAQRLKAEKQRHRAKAMRETSAAMTKRNAQRKREDFSQAAFRVVSEATKD